MKAQAKVQAPTRPPLPPDSRNGRLPVKAPLPPGPCVSVKFTPQAMQLISVAAHEAGETAEEFIRTAVCAYVCMYLADSSPAKCPAIAATFGFSEEAA